jgi:hypothetical protein
MLTLASEGTVGTIKTRLFGLLYYFMARLSFMTNRITPTTFATRTDLVLRTSCFDEIAR